MDLDWLGTWPEQTLGDRVQFRNTLVLCLCTILINHLVAMSKSERKAVQDKPVTVVDTHKEDIPALNRSPSPKQPQEQTQVHSQVAHGAVPRRSRMPLPQGADGMDALLLVRQTLRPITHVIVSYLCMMFCGAGN
jgi:hypothetical protein